LIRLFLILLFSAGAVGTYYLLLDGYGGPFDGFINNYALEICVVIVAYFLSVLFKKISGNKFAKAIIIFILASCIEVAQYFEFNLFGSLFDPLDFVFYASALAFALFIDIQVIPRLDGTYEKIKF
jgi:hypothetical protein